MHLQLAARERVAQVFLDLAPLVRAILEVVRIEAVLPAPAPLGGVERQVGRLDQFVDLDAVVRRDGDADGGSDDRPGALDRIGLRDHLDHALGQLAELAAIVDVGQDHLELVAAEAADLATRPNDARQALRDLLEQVVARRVAERVVDLLEAVEIEHHQRAAALGRLVGGQRGGQPLDHAVAIGQTGQRIVLREARGIALLLVAGGDVLGAAAIADELVAVIELRLAGQRPEHARALVLDPYRQLDEAVARARGGTRRGVRALRRRLRAPARPAR